VKNVPFYSNKEDDMHCVQAVFRSLFDYFFNEKLSWKEIDKLMKVQPHKATWTLLSHTALAQRGINVKVIEPFDYKRFLEVGVSYVKSTYDSQTANYYLKTSNLLSLQQEIPCFLSSISVQKTKPNRKDIDDLLEQGYIVGCEINPFALEKQSGFTLHYILILDKQGIDYVYLFSSLAKIY